MHNVDHMKQRKVVCVIEAKLSVCSRSRMRKEHWCRDVTPHVLAQPVFHSASTLKVFAASERLFSKLSGVVKGQDNLEIYKRVHQEMWFRVSPAHKTLV